MAAPEDPIGTVRATEGILAVRAPSSGGEPGADTADLSWFIIDIGGGEDLAELGVEKIQALIGIWPIVYQPGSIAQVSYDGDLVAIFPGADVT